MQLFFVELFDDNQTYVIFETEVSGTPLEELHSLTMIEAKSILHQVSALCRTVEREGEGKIVGPGPEFFYKNSLRCFFGNVLGPGAMKCPGHALALDGPDYMHTSCKYIM